MRVCENFGKAFQPTKRGRRFERRLAERRERAAMEKKKTILDALYEARGIAERAEYRRASAVFEIKSVMGDMRAMKKVVNARDVERWYRALLDVLAELKNGGK
jgi:hypothetical protein